jgi:hypothetical protein
MGRVTRWLCIPSKSQRSDNQLRVFLILPYYTLHCLVHFPRRSLVLGIPKNNVDYTKEHKQTRRVLGFIIIPFFVLVHTSHCTLHTLIALPLVIQRLRQRSSTTTQIDLAIIHRPEFIYLIQNTIPATLSPPDCVVLSTSF